MQTDCLIGVKFSKIEQLDAEDSKITLKILEIHGSMKFY